MSLWFRNLIIIAVAISVILPYQVVQADSLPASVRVSSVCGDDVIEESEQCEGNNLGGATCVSLGYATGTLSCTGSCSYNTSQCPSLEEPVAGAGATPPPAKVILRGKVYPEAQITLLKDGQMFLTRSLDASGDFIIIISNLTPGFYTFSLRARDSRGRESPTFSVSVTASSGMTTTISGIFLAPTIELTKTKLKKGEILTLFGQTISLAEVTIYIIDSLGEEVIKTTKAKTYGTWIFSLDTSVLKEEESYTIKAKAKTEDLVSSFFSSP